MQKYHVVLKWDNSAEEQKVSYQDKKFNLFKPSKPIKEVKWAY